MNTTLPDKMSSTNNSRVRVVVRIRPLSSKEISGNHKNILEGSNHHIVAWDPTCFEQSSKPDFAILDSSCWSREFGYDRCLWSTDVNSPACASQSDVYDEVGQPVLNWIMEGFNCCVFAFGQTGAGVILCNETFTNWLLNFEMILNFFCRENMDDDGRYEKCGTCKVRINTTYMLQFV